MDSGEDFSALPDKPPELLFVSIGDSYVEAEAAVDLATRLRLFV